MKKLESHYRSGLAIKYMLLHISGYLFTQYSMTFRV
jgi:hypothetical protein